MAELQPFSGYRFHLEKPEDLERYIAPPYDMLDNRMINELYNKCESNIVRIIQNRPEEDDTSNADRHRRAATTLSDWIATGIIRRDDEPSLYVYEQQFDDASCGILRRIVRTGVVALVKLSDFREGIVFPHEATLSGPKKDRYELLDATRTCTEQIFGLLNDDGTFYSFLREQCSRDPDGVFTDPDGVVHSLYRCSNRDVIDRLIALAHDRSILIADGHHRYETALNFYHDRKREEYGYTQMTLVSTADPGLIIRPFHRLVKKAGNPCLMREKLKDFFELEDYGKVESNAIFGFLTAEDDRIMVYLDSDDGHLYGCTLNSSGREMLSSLLPEQSDRWKQLPVSIINVLVINTILGLPLDGKILHDVVEYVNDVEKSVSLCRDNATFHGGFFIRPASIRMVSSIVASGERMPQKSTNFFPKMYSGLVLHRMECS